MKTGQIISKQTQTSSSLLTMTKGINFLSFFFINAHETMIHDYKQARVLTSSSIYRSPQHTTPHAQK